MKTALKNLTFLVLLIAIVKFVPDFCAKQTDEFSLCRLQSAFPSDPNWDTPPLNDSDQFEFKRAIAQQYHYLGSGGQCFAFESEDGQYVIKFFRHKLRKPQRWLLSLPLPEPLALKQAKAYNRLLNKHHRDFNSYKLAYEVLKEETGLICIHLNKTSKIGHHLTVSDKLHIRHQIDLDQTEFILQKKAELVYPSITKMMEEGHIEEAKKSLHAILGLIVSRCQKGIFDEDPRIQCNVGLIGTEAIFIDVGRFKKDEQRSDPEVYMHDLAEINHRFKGWLAENHPSLVPVLEEEMEQLHEMR